MIVQCLLMHMSVLLLCLFSSCSHSCVLLLFFFLCLFIYFYENAQMHVLHVHYKLHA